MPVADRMDEQQLTIVQTVHVAHSTDEITEAGKRVGTVVVVAGDTDPCLFQREAGAYMTSEPR